jgi:hypothetical protein
MLTQRNTVRLLDPTASYLHRPQPTFPDLQAGQEASIDRLVLRLQQSTRGLSAAAKTIADDAPGTMEWLSDLGSRRRDDLRRLLDLTSNVDRPTRSRSDLAGTVHRWFLRMVAPAGPGAVLDEVDRGETALRRAAHQAGASQHGSTLGRTLTDLSVRLNRDLEEIRRRRRRLDRTDPRGFAGGVGNPPHHHPDSSNREERNVR